MPYCKEICFQEYLICKKKHEILYNKFRYKDNYHKINQIFIDSRLQYNCWVTLFSVAKHETTEVVEN